jgi:hypothetical protein
MVLFTSALPYGQSTLSTAQPRQTTIVLKTDQTFFESQTFITGIKFGHIMKSYAVYGALSPELF